MPQEYRIDKAQRAVFSRAWGVLTNEDIVGHHERLSADPDFDPSFVQVADFRDVTEVRVTHEGVRRLVALAIFGPRTKRAAVVKDDLQYGIVRSVQLWRDLPAEIFGIFRDLDEACRFVGVTPPAP